MMRRTRLLSVLLTGLMAIGGVLVVGLSPASAHECWDPDNPPPDFPEQDSGENGPGKGKGKGKNGGNGSDELPEGYWRDGDKVCRDTTVQPNWRDNHVPLFDLADRDDEQQRYDAQRWREECNPRQNEYQQTCTWSYGGFSLVENRDDPNRAPNEWHLGFGMTHCGGFEGFHQCEDHEVERGEGVHDAHGGAIFVDVCLTPNPESKYCEGGPEDTQAGVVVMDHLGCGTFVPVASCTDNYTIVRPLDTDYTQRQMENSAEHLQLIVDDPARYFCGHHESGQSCRNNLQPLNDATASIPSP